MSWWIKEHIAVNEDETKQLCSIEADTAADLPAADQSATAGFIIVRGSDAKDVSTGDKYIMDSTGTWKQQPSGVQLDLSGYATQQDLTEGLAAKVDTTTYTAGQEAQDEEISYSINTGAKNLLKSSAVTQTINGVTFTVNDDQTITVNGTATANADFSLNTALSLTAGSYILSGCPSGGNNSTTFKLQIQGIGYDTGNGLTFNLSAARNINTYIRIWSGYTANNLVFRPMIRIAEITDDTFVPYAPTNRELYETAQQQAIRFQDSGNIRLNQLSWSQTSGGTGVWIADAFVVTAFDTVVSAMITSFGALKPSEITSLWLYLPSSVSDMKTIRVVCDQDLTGLASNPTLRIRAFGYGT